MADRNPQTSKKSSQNHRKRKNRASKRKSNSSTPTKYADKSNSSKNKYSFFAERDKFVELNYDDLCASERGSDNQQNNYCSPNNKIQRNLSADLGKHNKHDASNFSGVFSHNMHDGNGSYENHVNHNACDRTMFTNNQHSSRPSRSQESTDSLVQKIDFLTNEVNILTEENVRLTEALNDIKNNWSMHSNSDIEFVFKTKHLEEKFSHILKDLVSNLICGKISVEQLSKLCSSASIAETPESPEPLDDCLFAVDPSAEPVQSGNTFIPRYDASFQEILESPNDSKNASPNSSTGRFYKSLCFNCNEDHHMNSCPYKKDFRKIANNRKRAKSNFVPSVRYHVQGQNESDFKPGKISDELREALGLQRNQIPPYVYTMRVLDYPPGWLCEAAVESSGMVLYDSEGNALKDQCEDGEVEDSRIRVQYDPEKLIDYPGFNVPLPPDMIDECVELGFPPLQNHQLRCIVEQCMAKPERPNRKRKIELPSDRPSKIQRCEEDMDIEENSDDDGNSAGFESEFIPPLPEESAPPAPPPPPPPPPDSQETIFTCATDSLDENSVSLTGSTAEPFKDIKSDTDFSGTSSLSLADLEELKKKLVMELVGADEALSNDASREDDLSGHPDFSEDKTSDSIYVLDECVGSDLSNLSESSSTLDKTSVISECQDSLNRTTSSSKCVALGTPSLSCHSPYAKLPDYEQFSKNVSAHIPFENLPSSTGTYEKMKNVIKKVKDKLNAMMN